MSKTASPSSKRRSAATAKPKPNTSTPKKPKKKESPPKSPTCPDTVKADIEACLTEAPTGDPGADSVETWLFTSQNSVAVRVCRILEDNATRKLLTEAAGRTWTLVTDPKGKALRLWARLNSELESVANSDAKALQCKVDHAPDGVFAGLFSPKYTYHDAAWVLWHWTRGPVAVKADLIFPYHLILGLLPIDKILWNWVQLPHADRLALRYPPAGEPAQAMPMPPIGDFVAPLVLNRLGMVVSLTQCLHAVASNWADDRAAVNWHHDLSAELGVVRRAIWDAPDAQARAGAMALLQTYLGVEAWRPGFEADWSVIPWPKQPASEALFIGDRPEDAPKASDVVDELRRWGHYDLGESFKDAMDRNPGEVVKTVKAGLTWLAELPSIAKPNGEEVLPDWATGEQPWNDDAPAFKTAKKTIDKHNGKKIDRTNVIHLTLDRLRRFVLKFDITHMQRGRRLKVHAEHFAQAIQKHGRQLAKTAATPEFLAKFADTIEDVRDPKDWYCDTCGNGVDGATRPQKCLHCGTDTMVKGKSRRS